MTASALYAGTVRHRRLADPPRSFRYRVNYAYLDLDELPGLAGGRLVRSTPGSWRFRRRDYHGGGPTPLATAVRDTVESQTGSRPAGPIRLLTQLRCFGMSFNPVSLYYLFDLGGERVSAVLAEVTSTPWRERHAYTLGPWAGRAVLHSTSTKQMHVSPFLGMDQRYDIRLTPPGETLSVQIDCHGPSGPVLDATLALHHRPLTEATLDDLIRRDPVAPLRTLALIYGQGIALKRAGAPVHPRPSPPST